MNARHLLEAPAAVRRRLLHVVLRNGSCHIKMVIAAMSASVESVAPTCYVMSGELILRAYSGRRLRRMICAVIGHRWHTYEGSCSVKLHDQDWQRLRTNEIQVCDRCKARGEVRLKLPATSCSLDSFALVPKEPEKEGFEVERVWGL